jgi:hypothetical protein
LLANEFYRFEVDPDYIAKDLAGNLLDITGSGDGWGAGGLTSEVYNNSGGSPQNYDYRTASGGAPGAPTGVLLTVNNKTVIDYADAANGSNKVNLAWLAPSSGAITAYKVYVGKSSSGPWERIADDAGNYFIEANFFSSEVTDVNEALYGDMYNADCLKMLAFVTDPVYFKVVAFNGEGETAATAVATRDAVKPTVPGAPAGGAYQNPGDAALVALGFPASLAAALPNYASSNLGCYIAFSEPMNLASLTDTTKYTPGTGSVNGATVVYNSEGLTLVKLTFDTANVLGSTVTVATDGPVDLSGNVMNSTGNVNRPIIQ